MGFNSGFKGLSSDIVIVGCTCGLCERTVEVTTVTSFSVFVLLLEATQNILRGKLLTDRLPMEMDG